MIVYGILEIVGNKKHRTQITHTNEICEICGIVDDALIWHGVGIESLEEEKRLIYDSTASVILCGSCRTQSNTSKSWQLLQKKET
jgi:hypothetical protein